MAAGPSEVLGFIATHVRSLRQLRDLTQEQLAELGQFDSRFLRDVEGGKKDIAISTLVRLAEVLKVTPGALLRPTRLSLAKPGRPKKP